MRIILLRAAQFPFEVSTTSNLYREMPTTPKEKVNHKYFDFSALAGVDSMNLPHSDEGEQNFPCKLHFMLADVERDGLQHIVGWQVHGRAFAVHDPAAFTEKMLPLYFRQSKITSFQRQLNLYGFKRLTTGLDRGCYYHELFLRSKRSFASRIPRVKIKGYGARKTSNPDEEPDFYSMAFLPEENPTACGNHPSFCFSGIPSIRNSQVVPFGSYSLQELFMSRSLLRNQPNVYPHSFSQVLRDYGRPQSELHKTPPQS